MSIYNSILNRLILPLGDTFFGGHYLKHLREWKNFDTQSEHSLSSIQDTKLNALLDYCIEHVPYYKTLKNDGLESFPILTKQILRERTPDLISDDYNIKTLNKNFSSGSSGEQSFTYMTKHHQFYLRALQTHWWNWSGYKVGDPLLQFGISHKRSFAKRLKDFFYRCTYVKAFGLSENELSALSLHVKQQRNLSIAGYPSVINQLAEAAIKNQNQAEVRAIICFGDKLFQHYEKTIYNAFGNNVNLIDTYGCAEGILMACKVDLDYYYIMSPHVVIEIVDDYGNPIPDGEMGHVLVTCLTNFAMPIIRYKLGDLAIKLPKDKYPKKRQFNYPLLQKVVGRETDIIKTTKGITLNVHSFTGVLEYFQEIKQYKVIQNDLEHIIIEYIADTDFKIDCLKDIKQQLNDLTHNSLEIVFKAVESIKPTSSGKPQIIESNLKAT